MVLGCYMYIKHGFRMSHVRKNMVLPWYLYIKHGFTMYDACLNTWIYHVTCPQKHGFTMMHVHKTWLYYDACLKTWVYHVTCPQKHGFTMMHFLCNVTWSCHDKWYVTKKKPINKGPRQNPWWKSMRVHRSCVCVSRSCGGTPCWWRCWRWRWDICTTLTRSCRPACWTTSANPCRRWSWVAAQSPAPRCWRRRSHAPGRPSSQLRRDAGREWQWGELL